MKKFLLCGFASSFIWGCFNLCFYLLSTFAYSETDNPSSFKKCFILITVFAFVFTAAFFLIGRCFDHADVNPLIAAIIFAIPHLILMAWVCYSSWGSSEIGLTITWWTSLLYYATDGKTHYEESFAVNAALTYIPIFVSYLGMITKKKKETTE